VVVGGGFIGLEMAENLVHRGFDVTVLEKGSHVLAPLDVEFGRLVGDFLSRHGVEVVTDDGVASFAQGPGETLIVTAESGNSYAADIVILAIGVRPGTELAKAAGLAIGERGGIRVDEHMRTSDPDIFAVGDAVEVRDFVTGQWGLVALAGPANRQGRIAADVIAGRDSRFRGTQGTSIVGLFGAVVAWTGANEQSLARAGVTDYEKVHIFPNSHAGYYPGAKPIAMKVIFRRSDGRLLGAQAVGEDGVDKRISHLAMAIQMGATVYDLEEAELCYAPPFGSAKDPVNFAGMVAADVLRGDMPVSHWDNLDGAFVLDVREPAELAVEHVPGAVNIPLGQLRARLDELPRDRAVHVVCRSGQRAYLATRVLIQHGIDARNVSGGMLSHAMRPGAATIGMLPRGS
jgi:rhodanese-related sulfurtransferase/thioredoxin reductase